MNQKFVAQLFTVREELAKGIHSTFKELHKMGWESVQLSALPAGYDEKEVAESLKEFNFKAAGMHVSLERMQEDLSDVAREVSVYGTKDIICPYLPNELQNESGYKEVKQSLNEMAKNYPDYRISYHNHAFELQTNVEGMTALEYLLLPEKENLLLAEIDVFWVKKAGFDPLAFIQPYANRMPIIHLKDMTNDEEETFAEIGTGTIDFLPILQWGEKSGVEFYAVEQDQCKGNPLDSLALSFENLMKLKEQM